MKTNIESITSGKYTKSVSGVHSCQNMIYHTGRSKWKKMGNHHTVTVTITPIIDLRSPKYICYKKKNCFADWDLTHSILDSSPIAVDLI